MNTEELKQIHTNLSDIYFDIIDLRKGEICECYDNQDDLLDDLVDKMNEVMKGLPSYND